jgi:hypothetical protein
VGEALTRINNLIDNNKFADTFHINKREASNQITVDYKMIKDRLKLYTIDRLLIN